ncbi:MAG: hypothetical protein LC114_26730 [Bryobacterales bacterium]|nr:hypothetical protein [Bryobacterales bacterium]
MKRLIYSTLIIVSLSASSFGAAIGTITSNGRFEIEGASIWNHGTLLDGSRIATGPASSRLHLASGNDIRLGTASRARVYADRLLLESGTAQGNLPASFRMETSPLGLRIEGTGSDPALAQVRVNDKGEVLIASLAGSLAVRGPRGVLLAQLLEGNAVQLSATEGGATASTKLTGVVTHKAGTYFLTDEVTGVTAELRGEQIAKYVGKQITATGDLAAGTTPAAGAEYVVVVHSIELPAAASGSAAAAAAGMSVAAKAGIVAGIAVAGGVTAGVVAAGDESPETVSPEPR